MDRTYPLLLHGVYDAVLVSDGAGRIVCVNEKAGRLFGVSPDAMTQLGVSALIPAINDRALGTSLDEDILGLIEADCRRVDGSLFPAEVAVGRMRDKSGEQVFFFVRNSQHHKRAEQELKAAQTRIARAERLETAGTIAGQIAHDFNNLLTPLLAYPTLIRREVSKNSRGHEYLDVIEKTTQDMSHLTQQLLSLSRRGQLADAACSVNDIVEQVIKLMDSSLPKSIAVEFDLASDLLPVQGEREQLVRVLQNLCQNAIDSMGEKGVLRLNTENVYLDAPVGQYDSVHVGEYVKLTVNDTGSGIPEEIRERIFDPFFTTKKASKQRGSGLGLSIVHGIVKDHHGYIDMDSAVGRGTTFTLYFPISRSKMHAAPAPTLRGGTETILVVDDDAPQIQVIIHLLSALGYRVVGAHGGEEAVRLVEQGANFDLAIIDMIMDPGIDGLETFKRLRRIRPEQRALLISGFQRAKAKVAVAQSLGAGAYVRKPLTLDKLGNAVRQELDAARLAEKRHGSILVVDDEESIRKLFKMIIAYEIPGALVDAAADGKAAVKAFVEGRHSVLVMDLYMPVMDGRQAFAEIEKLCAENGWVMPAVIFCTGFTLPESLDRIIADGRVHCLLRKPVRADVLVRTIRERL